VTEEDKCLYCLLGYIHAVDKSSGGHTHIHDYCDGCSYRACLIDCGVCEWSSGGLSEPLWWE
jgi:hypothetical protein